MSVTKNTNKKSIEDYPLHPFFTDTEDLLCIAGFDGFFKKINPAVSKLLGFSEEELYSRSIKSFIHPLDQEKTWAYRKKLIEGSGITKIENRYLTKDGKTIWLSWTSIPVKNYDVVYAIAKNITESKQRESERNKLVVNLTKINSELKNISYTTSHDLRTPVNNLMSVFSLLDVSKIQDPETLEFIHILKEATDNLKSTLNDYVDLLNEKNLAKDKVSSLSLKTTLEEVVSSVKSLINETKTEVDVQIPDDISVRFNKGKLKSVLLNLLTNSIKYSHDERSPVITIRTFENETSYKLTFSDNGIGFDVKEKADQIFGLNQSFHNSGDSKGVGLYLVYNHMKDMGGNISVESEVGEGTTFTLTFRK